MTPGTGGPSTFGFRYASNRRCNCPATSGSNRPRTGITPSFARPRVSPRTRIAISSAGSAPSGSRYCTITCANNRRSSGVAADPTSPTASESVSASGSGSGSASAAANPRAYAANSASARNRSAVPTRAPACSIGPIAANSPATPIAPSTNATRSAGHRAGNHAPDDTPTSRRTAFAAITTPPRPRSIRAHHPLQQLVHRATAISPTERRLPRPRRPLIDRRDRLHDHRPHPPLHLTRDPQQPHLLVVTEPGDHVRAQHRIQVSDDLAEQFRGVVHTPKSTRDHRHSNPDNPSSEQYSETRETPTRPPQKHRRNTCPHWPEHAALRRTRTPHQGRV